ncbi:unnamed protein product [Bursaphelenchus xylophilus]|nr:unnamed protein product [Bursaphelenchus xylophilus]CAG9080710.1 unnamed protein product [Bursaphelenchus xylophilus]
MIAKTFLLLTIAFFVGDARPGGKYQYAGAKGRLLCNGIPQEGARIRLWDEDVFLDDSMAETTSDKNGYFELKGHAEENFESDIDPKINIDHNCDDAWIPCDRRLTIYLPDSYITNGRFSHYPKKLYDVGTLELSGKMSGESRDCIH